MNNFINIKLHTVLEGKKVKKVKIKVTSYFFPFILRTDLIPVLLEIIIIIIIITLTINHK